MDEDEDFDVDVEYSSIARQLMLAEPVSAELHRSGPWYSNSKWTIVVTAGPIFIGTTSAMTKRQIWRNVESLVHAYYNTLNRVM